MIHPVHERRTERDQAHPWGLSVKTEVGKPETSPRNVTCRQNVLLFNLEKGSAERPQGERPPEAVPGGKCRHNEKEKKSLRNQEMHKSCLFELQGKPEERAGGERSEDNTHRGQRFCRNLNSKTLKIKG